MIELPKKNNDSDVKDDDKNAAAPANDVMNKLGALTDEIGQMNRDRRDKEAAEQAGVEEDEAAKLAAEADLKALMEGVDDAEAASGIRTRRQQVDDMSNSEVMDVISTAIETALNARFEQSTKDVDKKFKTTADAMGKIIGLLGKMQANAGLERIKSKYPDFDKFAEDTGKVLDKYPMMDIEDAHLLARKRREGDSLPASQTDFERPSDMLIDRESGRTTGGGAEAKARKDETTKSDVSHGIVAFRSILDKALNDRKGK